MIFTFIWHFSLAVSVKEYLLSFVYKNNLFILFEMVMWCIDAVFAHDRAVVGNLPLSLSGCKRGE